jgi:hypothetical protein
MYSTYSTFFLFSYFLISIGKHVVFYKVEGETVPQLYQLQNSTCVPVSPTKRCREFRTDGTAAFPAEARKVGMMGSTPEEEVGV